MTTTEDKRNDETKMQMKMKRKDLLAIGDPLIDVAVSIGQDTLQQLRETQPNLGLGDLEEGGWAAVDLKQMRSLENALEEGSSLTLTSPPSPASSKRKERCAGGSASNLSKALSQLGSSADVWGALGEGEEGDFFRRELREKNVDVIGPVKDCASTGQCLCLISPSGERTMRTYMGASALVSEKDWDAQVLRSYRHVHVEGYFIRFQDTLRKIFTDAKRLGCGTSLDLASFELVRSCREKFTKLLESTQGVDILFCNESEAKAFVFGSEKESEFEFEFDGEKEEDRDEMILAECLRVLRKYARVAVISLGAKGCITAHGDHPTLQTTKAPAPKIPQVVDTTGAGDFFTAGFLHEHLKLERKRKEEEENEGKDKDESCDERSMESCCRVACNAGAAACMQYGTKIDQATFDALMNEEYKN